TRPTMEDFHQVLCSTVTEYSKVFIVIDGSDEYPELEGPENPEGNRTVLLKQLSNLGPNVNLMFTSRPNVNILTAFDNIQTLEIRATPEDIGRYMTAQITKSPLLSKHVANCPDLRKEIETLCVDRSDGMFLLAKLHMTSLTKPRTIKAVREALKQMSSNLPSAYKKVMEWINRQSEEDRKLALTTLAWVSNAKRPMRVSELREALAVELGTSELDSENLLDIDSILSVCAGLVIKDQTDNVRLIHYTTQEHLDGMQHIQFPSAQTDITMSCITYLSFAVFVNNPLKLSVSLEKMKKLQTIHPLLDYALEY
ncbi:hypothetical protein B0H13DRAFT_1496488, partial [Mycena leptocephala]